MLRPVDAIARVVLLTGEEPIVMLGLDGLRDSLLYDKGLVSFEVDMLLRVLDDVVDRSSKLVSRLEPIDDLTGGEGNGVVIDGLVVGNPVFVE